MSDFGNKTIYYKAKFIWNVPIGKFTGEAVLNYLEGDFMNLRSKAVKILNPMFDKWNSEYDENINPDYNDYISNKMNDCLRYNKIYSRFFEIKADHRDGDLYGSLKPFNDRVKVYLTLVPVTKEDFETED